MVSFHANCVAVEDMEDFILVGFADEEYETKQYLTLQRSYEDDEQDVQLGMDTYYVERNDQGNSCYGGIKHFELRQDRVRVTFDAMGSKKIGTDGMQITFKPDGRRFPKLRRRLETVFAGSEILSVQTV